jgi:hypothetical protein
MYYDMHQVIGQAFTTINKLTQTWCQLNKTSLLIF